MKMLVELQAEIDAGAYVEASIEKLGHVQFYRHETEGYMYTFEYLKTCVAFMAEDANKPLDVFLQEIMTTPIEHAADPLSSQDTVALAEELRGYLHQPIWSVSEPSFAAEDARSPFDLAFTSIPEEYPFQPIYNGGTWKPCLIIDGPNAEGYAQNGRVVCDAKGALHLLNYLKSHEADITRLTEADKADAPAFYNVNVF